MHGVELNTLSKFQKWLSKSFSFESVTWGFAINPDLKVRNQETCVHNHPCEYGMISCQAVAIIFEQL